jgi:hypothetical protein
MSIRDDAYQLCKIVSNSSSRDKVKGLINSLNRAESGTTPTKTDRSSFGYIARHLNAQILGYLITDLKREEFQKAPFPQYIPPLTNQERCLLSSVHKQIIQLNKQCIAPIEAMLPHYIKMLDPYNKFQYIIPPDSIEIDILPNETIKDIAASFRNHPAIAVILEKPFPKINSATETKYMKSVAKLTDILLQAGPLNAPADFIEIIFKQNKNDQRRIVARQLTAIICLRESLAVLNQLIFQAILNDKLPVLNEDNIIDIHGPVSHVASGGFSIIYQPDEQTLIVSLLDLILVKCMSLHVSIDQLGRVEMTKHEYSGDFGSTIECELRNIDENLDPFGTLLEQI